MHWEHVGCSITAVPVAYAMMERQQRWCHTCCSHSHTTLRSVWMAALLQPLL